MAVQLSACVKDFPSVSMILRGGEQLYLQSPISLDPDQMHYNIQRLHMEIDGLYESKYTLADGTKHVKVFKMPDQYAFGFPGSFSKMDVPEQWFSS